GRSEDGHVEAALQRCVRGHTEPVEQAAVCGAAAQVHMLAGVHHQAVPGERHGGAAEPGLGLEQRDVRARLAERDRRGDPGEPPADDYGLHWLAPLRAFRRSIPASACTATSAFCPAGSDILPCRTADGWLAMRSSSRR